MEYRRLYYFLKLLLVSNYIIPCSSSGIVPGNPVWLGDPGEGDGTPPIEDYLPVTYVIHGNNRVAIVRMLVDLDSDCPELVTEDGYTGDLPSVNLRAAGDFKLPYAFPIRVCEILLETEQHKEDWTAGRFYIEGFQNRGNTPVVSDPERFLLIGDTGLQVKAKNLGLGDCTEDGLLLYHIPQCPVNFTESDLNASEIAGSFQALSDWTLKTLQDYGAEQDADVVVYLGDFLYRQSPCPQAGEGSCLGINVPVGFNVSELNGTDANFLPGQWGDNLFGWWADFFWPSWSLLQVAPLIATRGNHEDCARGGHGWNLFLSPHPYPAEHAGEYCIDTVDPWVVKFKYEAFLVVDDSAVNEEDDLNSEPGGCPPPPLPGDPPLVALNTDRRVVIDDNTIHEQIAMYTAFMEYLEQQSEEYDTNFYTAHRPIFGIDCNATSNYYVNGTSVYTEEPNYFTLDWTMQQSLGPHTLDRVSALLSGHMHMMETITFVNDTIPPQIVVGHGGTEFDPNNLNQSALPGLELRAGKDDIYRGTVERGISSTEYHGFAIMTRNANGDYDIKWMGLNQTTLELIQVDYELTIRKGPRVKRRESSPTASPTEDLGELNKKEPTISPQETTSMGSENWPLHCKIFSFGFFFIAWLIV